MAAQFTSRSRAKERACGACGASITGRENTVKYCSKTCKERARTERARQRRLAIAAANPKSCNECGQPIPLKRSAHRLAKYCSQQCYRKASKHRHKSGYGRCVIDGCDGTAHIATGRYAGLCAAHTHRKRNGKDMSAPIVRKKPVAGLCSFPDCGRGVRAQGLCATHYEMQRRGEPLRPVGLLPHPRAVPVGTQNTKTNGYVRIKTAEGWRFQHHIVMEALIGRPLFGHENVHHKNGDRADNRPSNLELWSRSQPQGNGWQTRSHGRKSSWLNTNADQRTPHDQPRSHRACPGEAPCRRAAAQQAGSNAGEVSGGARVTDIVRVEQAGRHDCGVACLAMGLGKPLDHVEDILLLRKVGELVDPEPDIHTKPGDAVIGVTSFEMQAILWDMGIRHLYLSMPGPPDCEGAGWYDRVGRDMPVLDTINRVGAHLDRGGLAILGVDSLRYEGGKHWIVANGHDLFDPAPGDGARYESIGQFSRDDPMKVSEAVLIEGAPP